MWRGRPGLPMWRVRRRSGFLSQLTVTINSLDRYARTRDSQLLAPISHLKEDFCISSIQARHSRRAHGIKNDGCII